MLYVLNACSSRDDESWRANLNTEFQMWTDINKTYAELGNIHSRFKMLMY